jgi:hypothetical protein
VDRAGTARFFLGKSRSECAIPPLDNHISWSLSATYLPAAISGFASGSQSLG